MAAIAERDGGWFCAYCGIRLVPVGQEPVLCVREERQGEIVYGAPAGWAFPTIDHVIPRCRGGTNDKANLVLACNQCNTKKGTL